MGLDLSTCVCIEEETVEEPDKKNYGLWDLDASPNLKHIQQTIATQTMMASTDSESTTTERADIWLMRKQVFDFVSNGNVAKLEKVIADPRVNISTFVWKVYVYFYYIIVSSSAHSGHSIVSTEWNHPLAYCSYERSSGHCTIAHFSRCRS